MFLLSRRAASALSLGALFVLASCSGGGGGSGSVPATQPLSPQSVTSGTNSVHAASLTPNVAATNCSGAQPVKSIQSSVSSLTVVAGSVGSFIVCDQFFTTFTVTNDTNPSLVTATLAKPNPPVNDVVYTQTVNVTAATGQSGSASITVTDKKGNSVTVQVTVTQPIGTPVTIGAGTVFGQSSSSITTTAAAPAGSTVILLVYKDLGQNPSCSDSSHNTYLADYQNASGFLICSARNLASQLAAGSTITVSVNCPGTCDGTVGIFALAVTGLASSPLDQTAFSVPSGFAMSSGPVQTTQANELLLVAFHYRGGLTLGDNGTQNNCTGTQSSTYTNIGTMVVSSGPFQAAYCAVNATGAYSAQGTSTDIGFWAAIATYKGATQ